VCLDIWDGSGVGAHGWGDCLIKQFQDEVCSVDRSCPNVLRNSFERAEQYLLETVGRLLFRVYTSNYLHGLSIRLDVHFNLSQMVCARYGRFWSQP